MYLYLTYNHGDRMWWVANTIFGSSDPGKDTRYPFYRERGGRRGIPGGFEKSRTHPDSILEQSSP